MTEQKLTELLRDMSLEEKVNQMSQVTGGFFNGEIVVTGPMADKGFTEDNVNLAGSVIGSMGAETLKSIQKNYMEKHPHHIPLLFMLDVINGYKTVFPIPLAQGASFEPELSEQCASVAAKEASVSGLHVTFAPMTDLVRDARWGRVMESTGEDPYLNSLFCAAMVRGFQGNSLKDNYAIAACVKHFAGYGAPTAGRDYNTVELSEHTFREFYLPSYQAGIDAGAALVMTSFNTVNGIPATGNKKLMRDILREQMKFDGVLISDWAAIEETIYHGYCADREEAAVRAVEAGVDIDMMTGIYSENLCQMVRDGKIREELIDEACLRILRLKNNLGLFENPYKDADQKKEKEYILCEEHRNLAREAAKKSFVLLKNEDHILPLEQQPEETEQPDTETELPEMEEETEEREETSIKGDASEEQIAAEQKAWTLINKYADPDYFLTDPERNAITDAQFEELRQAALQAVAGCTTQYEKIKAIMAFVADRTYYDYYAYYNNKPSYWSPYEVYE